MDYDRSSNMKGVAAIAQGTYTSDQTSSAFDTSLYAYKACTLAIYIGVGGITFDTSNYIEFKVTVSDDDNTYASATSDDVVLDYTSAVTNSLPDTNGTVKSLKAAHAAAEVFLVGIITKKRYVKIMFDFTGTHGVGTPLHANWVLDHPMSAPAWQSSVPDLV